MKSIGELDQLLVTMDVAVTSFRLIDSLHAAQPAKSGEVLIYYIFSGAIRLTIPKRGEKRCDAGTVVVVPPRMAPMIAIDDLAETVLGEAIVSTRLSGSMGLLDQAKVPIIEDMRQSPVVEATCEMLREGLADRSPRLGARALVNSLMKTCILAVLRRFFRRPGISQNVISALADPRLAGPIAFVLDKPGAPHSVASLADRAGVSRSTFARTFVEAMRLTPMEFVARARLHYAAEMLRTSSLPIKTIAAANGFASRSHFSRAFRDLYGIDPTGFRTQGDAEHDPSTETSVPDRPVVVLGAAD